MISQPKNQFVKSNSAEASSAATIQIRLKNLESEEYVDHGHIFTTNRIFNSKVELVDWAKETAMKANIYLIINRYQRSRTADSRPSVTLAYEHRDMFLLLGRNTIEEVLCLSAKRDYTVFCRNCKESNRYNMPLLEAVRMTPTGKNFTVATAFMRNEKVQPTNGSLNKLSTYMFHRLCQPAKKQSIMMANQL
ncbi:hypothetical protein M9H77_09725 [Catharanthus roseus]|uniref:Uncharacterized protein n=1 Tax=Catharanthus roseus TaxID=4058 RepID=A0ACC0C1J7_CATRO|nr:hypothetical protein M9H77_09725 [Catharanthus roseus]